MPHLSQYLVQYDYPEDTARIILLKFGNLVFDTENDFVKWIDANTLRIPPAKKKEYDVLKRADIQYDRALKDLVNQSELRQLKNYITRQIAIQKILDSGIDLLSQLQSLKSQFLNETEVGINDAMKTIIRNLIAGGPDQKLPSEKLQELINISNIETDSNDLGYEPMDMDRDSTGRLLSYYDSAKNKKQWIKIHPTSKRFDSNKFRFAIKSNFTDPTFIEEIAAGRSSNMGGGSINPTTKRLMSVIPDLVASSDKDKLIADLQTKNATLESVAASYKDQLDAQKIVADSQQREIISNASSAATYKNIADTTAAAFSGSLSSIKDNVDKAVQSAQQKQDAIQSSTDAQTAALNALIGKMSATGSNAPSRSNQSDMSGSNDTNTNKRIDLSIIPSKNLLDTWLTARTSPGVVFDATAKLSIDGKENADELKNVTFTLVVTELNGSSTLPDGMTFNQGPNIGQIQLIGAPKTAVNVTIRITAKYKTAVFNLPLTIKSIAYGDDDVKTPSVRITSISPLSSIVANQSYNYTVAAVVDNGKSTDIVNYRFTTQPTGLNIDSSTGVISGKLAGVGSYTAVVEAYLKDNTSIKATTSWNITVKSSAVGTNVGSSNALGTNSSIGGGISSFNTVDLSNRAIAATITMDTTTPAIISNNTNVFSFKINATCSDTDPYINSFGYAIVNKVANSDMAISNDGIFTWTVPDNFSSYDVIVKAYLKNYPDKLIQKTVTLKINNALSLLKWNDTNNKLVVYAGNTYRTKVSAYSDINADLVNPNIRYELSDSVSGAVIDPVTGEIIVQTYTGKEDSISLKVHAYYPDRSNYIEKIIPLSVQTIKFVSTPSTVSEIGSSNYTTTIKAVHTDTTQNDNIRYSLISSPSGMTIDQITGVISWTPKRKMGSQIHVDVAVKAVLATDSTITNYPTQSWTILVKG